MRETKTFHGINPSSHVKHLSGKDCQVKTDKIFNSYRSVSAVSAFKKKKIELIVSTSMELCDTQGYHCSSCFFRSLNTELSAKWSMLLHFEIKLGLLISRQPFLITEVRNWARLKTGVLRTRSWGKGRNQEFWSRTQQKTLWLHFLLRYTWQYVCRRVGGISLASG